MGVPYLFKWIEDNFSKIFLKKFPKVHSFYIDVNCIFHDIMNKMNEQRVVSKATYFAAVVEYIEVLVKEVQPEALVYIAVDGVVPAAKMKQQRFRRYKAAQGTPSDAAFQNIELSPQMPLMVELEAYLSNNLLLKHSNLQMILSSSAECGEGEHKILAHIRANAASGSNICIYGTDGDWLLLTLPLCGPDNTLSNIYILKDHFESQYYIDIQCWRAILEKKFGVVSDVLGCMRDVLLLSFLFGNDFVPSFYCLSLRFRKDKYQAMHVLSAAYKQIACNIVENDCINYEALFKLLYELQKVENELIDAKVDMEVQYVRHILTEYRKCPPEKKAAYREEFILPFRRTITNSSLTQPYIYRFRYYQHHLKTKCHLDWMKLDLCRDYLLALDWNFQYYRGNLLDWHYMYPHSIAPFIDDLYRAHRARVEANWQPRNLLTTDIQLLYIIPKSKLPPNLRPIANRPHMVKYFPSNLRIATTDRVRVWECECEMLLPDVNDFIDSYKA